MALPTSRDTTYSSGSQVKSADLNDIQDQIIALNSLRIGAVSTFLPGILFRGGFSSGETLGSINHKGYMLPDVAGRAEAPLILPVGARVLSLALYLATDLHTGSRVFNFNRTELSTDTVTTIATGSTSTSSGNPVITLSSVNHTILTGMNYWLEFDATGASSSVDAIKGVLMSNDHP